MTQTLALPVDDIAEAVFERLQGVLEGEDKSPWLNRPEAILYSRLPKGTFDKMAADGRISSHHNGRLFHRLQLDDALKRL